MVLDTFLVPIASLVIILVPLRKQPVLVKKDFAGVSCKYCGELVSIKDKRHFVYDCPLDSLTRPVNRCLRYTAVPEVPEPYRTGQNHVFSASIPDRTKVQPS